jgi:hypothetical protein
MTTIRGRAARTEEGSALVLALLFLTVCGVTIGGLLTFANTSSVSTTALRSARGADYDAQATMQAAIATVRAAGTTCATSGTTGVYTPPTANLNNPSVPLRVDCYGLTSASGQRNDVLSVCPASVTGPCPDAKSLLRANVIFYDTPTTGASIGIQTWSN